ncbi:MAG: sugar phosphate isomerase/epimerase [Chloroflexaceae bacterium]|nr:sugar phosphate isomerase/epimerase [Chloroflexaceae bacterium]
MHIGISSYSFARLMKKGMTYIEAASSAKAIGYDVFEVEGLRLPAGNDRLAYAHELKAHCHAIGITVGNFTVGADFLTGSGGDTDREIARVKDEIAIAVALGAPGMRHDATFGFPPHARRKSFADALPTLIRACREVSEYAAAHGVKTMVENHGFMVQDADRVEQLVCGVAHDNFGLLLDMGNFLCADESPAVAFGKLAPYAFHVHAKDFYVRDGALPNPGNGWFTSRAGHYLAGTVVGFGVVPVVQCWTIMKKAGYEGTVSLEFEGLEENLWALEVGHDNLRRAVAQA